MNATIIIIGTIAIVYMLVMTIVNACEIHFLKEDRDRILKEMRQLKSKTNRLTGWYEDCMGKYNPQKPRQMENK
jgi:hypothetical protein